MSVMCTSFVCGEDKTFCRSWGVDSDFVYLSPCWQFLSFCFCCVHYVYVCAVLSDSAYPLWLYIVSYYIDVTTAIITVYRMQGMVVPAFLFWSATIFAVLRAVYPITSKSGLGWIDKLQF